MKQREAELLEKMERDLNLKELQIKSLLTITQAINDNVSKQGLFRMYQSFLSWEMGINTMLLIVKEDEGWVGVSSINYDPEQGKKLIDVIQEHKRMYTVKREDKKKYGGFDIIIPVFHKDQAIAYALIGGIRDKEDLYNKIQFITTITNIISVAIENKRLFKKQLERQSYEKEMDLAKDVQNMLIPQDIPQSVFYDLDLVYQPHSSIGGDYIDFIRHDEGKFSMCIADISGKGISAAILMANFQATLRSLIFQYRDLETFVYALNEAVFKITKSERYITFFITEVDLNKRKMKYINAGHYPPLLFNNGKVEQLHHGTTIIGAFEKLPMLSESEIDLSEDAFLLAFTDGLADIKNELEQYFDEKELSTFIEKYRHQSANSFNKKLMEQLKTYKGNRDFVDDIAILTCKLHKGKNEE